MTFTRPRQGGFTLIELLVVIAIIGILATLILVALVAARNRARVARIHANLSQYRALAETYADLPGGYNGIATDTNAAALRTDITNQGGAVTNRQDASTFCIAVTGLPGAPSNANRTCRDSAGNAPVSATTACSTSTPFACSI